MNDESECDEMKTVAQALYIVQFNYLDGLMVHVFKEKINNCVKKRIIKKNEM